MMFWNTGWTWWQAAVMWLGMLAFWGLIIWAVYLLMNGNARDTDRAGPDARRIIDARLARGEITVDEYQRLRDALTGRESAPDAGSPRAIDHGAHRD